MEVHFLTFMSTWLSASMVSFSALPRLLSSRSRRISASRSRVAAFREALLSPKCGRIKQLQLLSIQRTTRNSGMYNSKVGKLGQW